MTTYTIQLKVKGQPSIKVQVQADSRHDAVKKAMDQVYKDTGKWPSLQQCTADDDN